MDFIRSAIQLISSIKFVVKFLLLIIRIQQLSQSAL